MFRAVSLRRFCSVLKQPFFAKLYARKKSNVGIFVACQPKDWDNHFDQHFFATEDFSLLMAKKCSKIKDAVQAVKKRI